MESIHKENNPIIMSYNRSSFSHKITKGHNIDMTQNLKYTKTEIDIIKSKEIVKKYCMKKIILQEHKNILI
jgi:hypothetical protein